MLVLWVFSGDRGPVWLCQTGHGGTRGCDAGCWLAHGRFQDAQLSGHQMGPQCPEGTLCNHTQGTCRLVIHRTSLIVGLRNAVTILPLFLSLHPSQALCKALKKWQESGDPSGKRRRSRASSERCYVDFHFEHGEQSFSLFSYPSVSALVLRFEIKVGHQRDLCRSKEKDFCYALFVGRLVRDHDNSSSLALWLAGQPVTQYGV